MRGTGMFDGGEENPLYYQLLHKLSEGFILPFHKVITPDVQYSMS